MENIFIFSQEGDGFCGTVILQYLLLQNGFSFKQLPVPVNMTLPEEQPVHFAVRKSGEGIFSRRQSRLLIIQSVIDPEKHTICSKLATYYNPHTSEKKGYFDMFTVTNLRVEGEWVTFVANGESHGNQYWNRHYSFKFESQERAQEFIALVPKVNEKNKYT